MEPQAARRALLVALQSLAPYCLARWAPALRGQEDDEGWREDYSPRASSTTTAASFDYSRLPLLPHQRLWRQVSSWFGPAASAAR